MGYFSSNIPNDHEEAQHKAKEFRSILEKGTKQPKGKVVSNYKKEIKSMFKKDKKKEIAEKMKGSSGSHGAPFGKLKSNQKGRESLEKPNNEKNEGESMYLGKNQHNRS